MLRALRELVEIESPSSNKPAVDRCAQKVASDWRRAGANVRIIHQSQRGNIVRAEISPPARTSSSQLLILGHLDTVYPMGTLARMPFKISSGRVWGPGTFDMKGGVILARFALEILHAARLSPRRNLVFLWTGDEEIGSPSSRKIIQQEAAKSAAALVLEPPFGKQGAAKTRRKGIGELSIVIHGRAAHAGVNPGDGINAAHELALQVARLMKMNDPRRGITVQANVISSGTASNVVPDLARADVDVRFARVADGPGLEKKLLTLKPFLKGAGLELRGGINRPPLERTSEVEKLYLHAREIARGIGFPLPEAATGGGSDGNLTAAMGVPTLDGIGAVGDGAHTSHEHVLISELPRRAAFLAALFATL
jgi:glutamate carboxypeptidase